MKVLVTGASGFIGRYLIEILDKDDYDVHGIYLSNNPGRALTNINWHNLDLFNYPEVKKFMKNIQPTHVIHLAWYTEHGKFWTSPKNRDWVNATIELFKSFKRYNGKKFISSGTKAEYFDGEFIEEHLETVFECKEGEAKNPDTLYGQSKSHLHDELKKLDEGNEKTLVWTRVFDTYGPNEDEKKFCSYVIKQAMENKEVLCKNPLLGMDFLHVKDIANAFRNILDSKFVGEVNISSGNSVTLKYIAEFILNKLDATSLLNLNHESKDKRKIYGNNNLLKSLGWTQKYDIEEGLSDLIRFYKIK